MKRFKMSFTHPWMRANHWRLHVNPLRHDEKQIRHGRLRVKSWVLWGSNPQPSTKDRMVCMFIYREAYLHQSALPR